jgi:glycosyltransferase involved in cell wall biosynthesis
MTITDIGISVLMITYNHAVHVGRAIEGVLAQRSDEPFELIIGEDCSTDGTRDIVESFRDRHPGLIRVVTAAANVGMNENLRRVALTARGEYIAFCEGDDLWHNPEKLTRQLAVARADWNIGMVYSDYDRASRVLGRWRVMRNVVGRSGEVPARGRAFEDLLDRVQVHLSTMLCRRSLVTAYFESDLYDPSLRLGDVPLLLYCAAHADVAYLPESTSVYRATPGSATTRGSRHRLRLLQDHVAVVRRFEERFGSDPERRGARAPRLNARIATGAYAACDREIYSAVADGGPKVRLRAALMRAPILHRLYMQWVAERQKLDFWRVSEDAHHCLN